MGAVHFSKGTKKENKGYGYSPIDFITDSLLLCEAERVFDQRLDIREISDIAVENNKPFITATFNCTLYICSSRFENSEYLEIRKNTKKVKAVFEK